jgi:ABC-type transport system involved in multi-copper enzyme maturation permease subunit
LIALFGRDPVALKELRGVSRRWHTYVGRCLFVGITAALLYQYWKENWIAAPGETPTMSVSQYAVLGRAIFVRCEWVSLGLTVLAAAIAGSESIAREIRAGTLSLLFLTPISPHRVVLGKWKGAVMIALALFFCSIPVLAIAVYLGGVGPEELIRSIAFTLSLSTLAAAVGLHSSARLKSAGAAVATTLPIMLGAFVSLWALDRLGAVALEMAFHVRASLVHQGGLATAAASVLATILILNAAVRQVRIRTGAIAGRADHARELRTLALDELREQRGSRPVRVLMRWRSVWENNPLLWKEFTLRPALRIREDWRARSYIVLYFLFLVSWIVTGYNRGAGFFPLWGSFFVVVAIAAGCLLFAPEKKGRQWMVLLSTPVTPAEIVRAKLLGGLLFPEALGLILLYVLAIAAWVGMERFEFIGAMMIGSSLFLLFCYALSAAASLRVRTARTAFLFTAGVVAALVTLPPLLSGAFRPLAGFRPSIWTQVWIWVEALDPVLVFDRFPKNGRYPATAASANDYDTIVRFFLIYLTAILILPAEMVFRFRKIALHA